MSLPLQKRNNLYAIKIAKSLYSNDSIERAIREHSDIARKSEVQKSRKYHKIELKVKELSEALEWANYLFYLNR